MLKPRSSKLYRQEMKLVPPTNTVQLYVHDKNHFWFFLLISALLLFITDRSFAAVRNGLLVGSDPAKPALAFLALAGLTCLTSGVMITYAVHTFWLLNDYIRPRRKAHLRKRRQSNAKSQTSRKP